MHWQNPAKYHYKYAVKDDYSYVDFGAKENRHGDYTDGYYYVVLPDGRRQIVNYYVDGYSGYVADVKYEGEAKYADSYSKKEYNAYKTDYPVPTYDSYKPKKQYRSEYSYWTWPTWPIWLALRHLKDWKNYRSEFCNVKSLFLCI